MNDKNAKRLTLFLLKNNDREYTVSEIKDRLGIEIGEEELIERLRMLTETDLVLRGNTSIEFRGISDNIIARVIRMYYEQEIEGISKEELDRRLAEERRAKKRKAEEIMRNKEMISRYHRGRFAEYCILYYLERKGEELRDNLKDRVNNLNRDVIIEGYRTILRFCFTIEGRSYEVDIYAKSKKKDKPILVWESKNYKDRKVGETEVRRFKEKLELIKKYESPHEVIGIFYSSSGFTDKAIEYMRYNNIVYTDFETLWRSFV